MPKDHQDDPRRFLAQINSIDVLHDHESPGSRPICYICGLPVEKWQHQEKCSVPTSLPVLSTRN